MREGGGGGGQGNELCFYFCIVRQSGLIMLSQKKHCHKK